MPDLPTASLWVAGLTTVIGIPTIVLSAVKWDKRTSRRDIFGSLGMMTLSYAFVASHLLPHGPANNIVPPVLVFMGLLMLIPSIKGDRAYIKFLKAEKKE
jgi:O-antigen/teichoic acid export membrane protein